MTKDRILSIDVLRGIIVCFMIIVNTPGSWSYVWTPLRHAEWHGCTPTDLVFPGFLFVVGLSMAISFNKRTLKSEDNTQLMLKVVKRSALIFLIGLLLNWFPFFYKHISDLRVFGVLQRIAMAYFVAGTLATYIKKNHHILSIATLLMLAHWFILFSFGGDNPYSLDGNISKDLDLFFLSESHVYGGFGIAFDPEGILGVMSSAAQILIAMVFAKSIILNKEMNLQVVQKAGLVSIGLFASGFLVGFFYPINKPLWTGSYVLYSSGILGLLLCFLIWLVDVHKRRSWAFPFRVFGLNPLISYVLSGVLVKLLLYVFKFEEGNGYAHLFRNVYQPIFGNYLGSFLFAVSITFVIWLFALVLYRKGKVINL